MSLSGTTQTYLPPTLDGLTIIDADQIYINGNEVDLNNLVPYTGASKTVNLGSQNIQTTHSAIAGPDLVNLTTLQNAIAYIDITVGNTFLNKTTTDPQTVAGAITFNGGANFASGTQVGMEDLMIKTNDGTLGWEFTTSGSSASGPYDLTINNIQTSEPIVFRDTGKIEAKGFVDTNATASKCAVFNASKELVSNGVDAVKLDYLDNVSSDIQTQLNSKASITYVDTQDGLRVLKTGDTMTGTLNMGANKITSSYVPSNGVDLCNKTYIDGVDSSLQTQINGKLSITGGTLTGLLTTPSLNVSGATASTVAIFDASKNLTSSTVSTTTLGYLDATSSVQTQLNSKATTSYVDTQDGLRVLKAGDTMTGTLNMGANKITSSYVPVNGVDLCNKTYVDSVAGGNITPYNNTWTGTNVFNNTVQLSVDYYNEKSVINYNTSDKNKWFKIASIRYSSSGLFRVSWSTAGHHGCHWIRSGFQFNQCPFVFTEASSSFGPVIPVQYRLSTDDSSIYNYGYLEMNISNDTWYVSDLDITVSLIQKAPQSIIELVQTKTAGTTTGYTYYIVSGTSPVFRNYANFKMEWNTLGQFINYGRGQFGFRPGSKRGMFIDNEDAYGGMPCIQGVDSGFGASSIVLNPVGGNVGIGRTNPSVALFEVAGRTVLGYIPASKGGLLLDSETYSNGITNMPCIQGVSSGYGGADLSLQPAGGQLVVGGLGSSSLIINDTATAKWKINTGSYVLSFSRHNSGTATDYTTWKNPTVQYFDNSTTSSSDAGAVIYSSMTKTNWYWGIVGGTTDYQGGTAIYAPCKIATGRSFQNGAFKFTICRHDTHENYYPFAGTFQLDVEGHNNGWGNGSEYLKIQHIRSYNTFVGRVQQSPYTDEVIVWLRIGYAYHFVGEGCYVSFPNNTYPVVSAVADAFGIQTYYSFFPNPDAPYQNYSYRYDSQSQLANYDSRVCIGGYGPNGPHSTYQYNGSNNVPLYVGGYADVYLTLGYWLSGGGLQLSYSPPQNYSISIWSRYNVMTEGWYGTLSDKRLKRNIKPVGKMLDIIKQIEVVSFEFIDSYHNKPDECGVIAQQLESVFPNAVDKSVGVIPCFMVKATEHKPTEEGDLMIYFDTKGEIIQKGDRIKLVYGGVIVHPQSEEHLEKKESPKEEKKGFEELVSVKEVIDGGVVVVIPKDYHSNYDIVVYGKEVNDLRNVDKEQLGVLALKGVQELSEKATSQASLVQEFHAKIESLQNTVDLLQKQGQDTLRAYDTLVKRDEVIVNHAKQLELSLNETQKQFEEYKRLSEERFEKLANLLLRE